MCVILIAIGTRPTPDMVEKAWRANDDGGGIAWREGENDKREVVWVKGIDKLEEMQKLCAEAPMPFVAHFRIASVGGIKKHLTHPFHVGPEASIALRGRTKGAVLFHNGHWANWNDKALDAAIHANLEVPDGEWSDTRAMAWMSHIYGNNFMELLPQQRGVLMTPEDMKVFTGNGWTKINNVWCSNDSFWTRSFRSGVTHQTSYTRRLCHIGRCNNEVVAGKDVCKLHESAVENNSINAASNSNGTPNTTALAKSTIGGTGANPGTPFTEVELLTLREAEIVYRRGEMSKNTIKKFRKQWDLAESKDKKRADKARAELRLLTAAVNRVLSNGRVH